MLGDWRLDKNHRVRQIYTDLVIVVIIIVKTLITHAMYKMNQKHNTSLLSCYCILSNHYFIPFPFLISRVQGVSIPPRSNGVKHFLHVVRLI